MSDLGREVRRAVRHFWQTRGVQSERQGAKSGHRDQGARSAVTGGAQMDGFAELVSKQLIDAGVPGAAIHRKSALELPGFFRPEKKWDLIVVHENVLLAAVEFKSQVGPSFGNNYNNRSEEAVGNATDLWKAYREGAFQTSPTPWLGYLMLLEDAPKSRAPVRVKEPHFSVFPEFHDASYAERYELLLTKLLRERVYSGTCLLLAEQSTWKTGAYNEPSAELGIESFIKALLSHVSGNIS